MPSALVPLANLTLGSTAAGVTFSSLNQTYRDLLLIVSGTSTSTVSQVYARFNGDTGTNYHFVQAYGDGTNTTSTAQNLSVAIVGYQSIDSTAQSTQIFSVMDYSVTDKQKSCLGRGASSATGTSMIASRWANTAAITSMYIFTGTGSFAAGSTFALYGVSA